MSDFRYPLVSIDDAGLEIAAKIPVSVLHPEVSIRPPMREVLLDGRLDKVNGDVFFRGRISGTYVRPCDRCLTETCERLDIQVTWIFSNTCPEQDTGEEPDDRLYSIEGDDSVDLVQPIWDEIALGEPRRMLCSPDCRGLCPRCGENLNLVNCNCDQKTNGGHSDLETGLKQLAALYPELKNRMKPEE
ncbi:MAG TPA: DUF177 domain-containing protein [Candidatus Hydrogenedentes bacterium]|nr:DUF177 domain-containing protein [Candidatus Hydrogenedentota bacterium]